jgi:hypothetical protein
LDPFAHSENYLGGAGTWSDGKLTTQIGKVISVEYRLESSAFELSE